MLRPPIAADTVDIDTGDDVVFWLWASVVYSVIRCGDTAIRSASCHARGNVLRYHLTPRAAPFRSVTCELLFPGKIRGYTTQQYVLSLGHQVVILPLCAIGWVLGLFQDAPALIYLLTGAYLTSDSIINYSPVSNCVTGEEGPPAFSWGVHAHHFFTVVLCALGTTLPPWPVREGAICILLGEVRRIPAIARAILSEWSASYDLRFARRSRCHFVSRLFRRARAPSLVLVCSQGGSLWITVTLLRPTALNFAIRYYSFLISRVVSILLAFDIARQIDYLPTQLVRERVAGLVACALECPHVWVCACRLASLAMTCQCASC